MIKASITASAGHPALLISDLHLSPAQPQTILLATEYLDQAHGASALCILGDLFEYWLGDDAIDTAMQGFIDSLKALSQSDTDIF